MKIHKHTLKEDMKKMELLSLHFDGEVKFEFLTRITARIAFDRAEHDDWTTAVWQRVESACVFCSLSTLCLFFDDVINKLTTESTYDI